MTDIDTTIANLTGTAVGVGVTMWGLGAITKQLDRGMPKQRKPRRRAAKSRRRRKR